jgi:hypothetical protein
MKFLDYYDIEIKLKDNIDVEITPTQLSFSITDSIYNLYNKAQLQFSDDLGLLQEYFFY